MAFRFALEALLNERSILPEELAEATGIPLETILSMCDNRAKDLSVGELDSLCEALVCQPGDIIKDE